MSLVGRTALVTGASSGIGEAIAVDLAKQGCNLVLWARRTDRLEALADRLRAEDRPADAATITIHTATVDVTDDQTVEAAIASLPPALSQIDILVNNAGLALGTAPVQALDLVDAATMIDVNVNALIRLTRALVPAMIERDAGHVLNISSVAAHYSYGGGSVYCGTKSFVRAFTDALRSDLVHTNVRVTAISPGAVRTEFSLVRFKGDEAAADAVYAGIEELKAGDVSDAVVWALTRPRHVQVGDIVLWATRQATPQVYGRRS